MGREARMVEAFCIPFRFCGIQCGGRSLFAWRDRRIDRGQASANSETNGSVAVNRTHCFRRTCGACLCASAGQSIVIGAICGAIGGIIGAFAGYEIRRRLVINLKMRDIPVALVEDIIAIGLAFLFVSR